MLPIERDDANRLSPFDEQITRKLIGFEVGVPLGFKYFVGNLLEREIRSVVFFHSGFFVP